MLVFVDHDQQFGIMFVEIKQNKENKVFNEMLLYCAQIFNDVTYLITCCTENEAHRYGRFLFCILEIVMRWRESEDIYKKVACRCVEKA